MEVSQGKERGFRRTLPAPYLESGDLNPSAVRFYRHQHGMTQEELAQVLNISRGTVTNVERGLRRPVKWIEHSLYNFCMATAEIMADNDGIVPPNRSFRHALIQPEDRRNRHLSEVMALRGKYIHDITSERDRLRRENEELRKELNAYKSGDYLNRINRLTDELEVVRQQVLRNVS